MAELVEIVELRKEYEQMRTLNVFSDEEIKKIKKARENFEYRIKELTCNVKDYLEYIKHERNLISVTKERIRSQNIDSSNTIVKTIVKRMQQLYLLALSKFPQDPRFWDEYIKFLQSFDFSNKISNAYERMLQHHGDKPEVWIRAILWEYNENYEEHRVKGMLLKAQQKHQETQKLYLIFFKIELENKQGADETLVIQNASMVYTNGKKKFSEIDYYIEMLNITDRFSYAKSIQNVILNDMKKLFVRNELLWHTLAQRCLHGFAPIDAPTEISENIKKEPKDGNNTTAEVADRAAPPQFTPRKRIELCIYTYESAVVVLDTKPMWDYYLNAMLELNTDLSTQPKLKKHALDRAFQSAYALDGMNEEHYIRYIKVLLVQDPNQPLIAKVYEKASTRFNTSLDIWEKYLKYCFTQRNLQEAQKVFKNIKENLGPDGYKLWELYVYFLHSFFTEDAFKECKAVINELAHQLHPQFTIVKTNILEWQAMTFSMDQTHKTYDLFIKSNPDCLEVYEKMADLIAKQEPRDLKAEKSCLETLVLNFGRTRTDVWLRLMKFERTVGEPKNVSGLYNKAVATLTPDLLQDFISLHNLLINNVV